MRLQPPVKTDFILTPKDILKPFIKSANGSQFDNTDRASAVVHLNVYLLQRLGIGSSPDKEIAFGQQPILTQALGA